MGGENTAAVLVATTIFFKAWNMWLSDSKETVVSGHVSHTDIHTKNGKSGWRPVTGLRVSHILGKNPN